MKKLGTRTSWFFFGSHEFVLLIPFFIPYFHWITMMTWIQSVGIHPFFLQYSDDVNTFSIIFSFIHMIKVPLGSNPSHNPLHNQITGFWNDLMGPKKVSFDLDILIVQSKLNLSISFDWKLKFNCKVLQVRRPTLITILCSHALYDLEGKILKKIDQKV